MTRRVQLCLIPIFISILYSHVNCQEVIGVIVPLRDDLNKIRDPGDLPVVGLVVVQKRDRRHLDPNRGGRALKTGSKRVQKFGFTSNDYREPIRFGKRARSSFDIREPIRFGKRARSSFDVREPIRFGKRGRSSFDVREPIRFGKRKEAEFWKNRVFGQK